MPLTIAQNILTWQSRFTDPAMDREYQTTRFPFELNTAQILIFAVLCQDMVTLPFEYIFLGQGGADRSMLYLLWLGMVTASLVSFGLTKLIRETRSLIWLVTSWAMTLVALNSVSVAYGPLPSQGTAVVFGVSTVFAYVLPLPLRNRLTIGISMTLGFLVPFLSRIPFEGKMLMEMGLGFLSANLIGSLISQRFVTMSCQEFAARIKERDARLELERASKQIQKLEGLLPICAHCKKIHLTKDKTENKLIVYVGDGRSDFCPARVSDIVFAKDGLLRFMNKEELPCISYKNLGDVHHYFQEVLIHDRKNQKAL